jgi:hypothetical protein
VNEQRFQIELNRSDYSAGLAQLMGQLAQRDTARQKMLFVRLAAYTAILVVISYAFPVGGMAVFSAILLFWLAEFLIQAAFKTQLVGISFEPEAHGRTDVEFDDAGIVETGASRTRRWAWDALRRVHLPKGYVVLELVGWDMIILPDRLWPTAEQRSAFIAELQARQPVTDSPAAVASPNEAMARLKLVEPILIARLFLAAEVFQRIFDSLLPVGVRPGPNSAIVALVGAAVGAGIVWWASGRAFRWLSERSPEKALAVAWGVIVLMAALFALWFFRLV